MDAKDGKDTKDIKDGKDTKDIKDGKDGKDGKESKDVKDGKDAKKGTAAKDAKNATDAKEGKAQIDGKADPRLVQLLVRLLKSEGYAHCSVEDAKVSDTGRIQLSGCSVAGEQKVWAMLHYLPVLEYQAGGEKALSQALARQNFVAWFVVYEKRLVKKGKNGVVREHKEEEKKAKKKSTAKSAKSKKTKAKAKTKKSNLPLEPVYWHRPSLEVEVVEREQDRRATAKRCAPLWLIRKTLLSTIAKRKFKLTAESAKVAARCTFLDFLAGAQSPDGLHISQHMSFEAENKLGHRLIAVYRHEASENDIIEFLQACRRPEVRQIILVSPTKRRHMIKLQFESSADPLDEVKKGPLPIVHIFQASEFKRDILDHTLVPQQRRLLDPEEAKAVREHFNIKHDSEFHIMLDSDAAARRLGSRSPAGDIYQFERPEHSWRVVIPNHQTPAQARGGK